MNLSLVASLLSPTGRAVLADAHALAPTEATLLQTIERLAKTHPRDLVRGAVETVLLRHRAKGKFSRAADMLFERLALEQASGEVIAAHRARRFVGLRSVADLCCGLGGDTIALAAVAPTVAVDRDPLRVALARHNITVHGLGQRVRFEVADVLTVDLSSMQGVFLDPDRRPGGTRQLAIAACVPHLDDVRERVMPDCPLGVKLAPGIPLDDLHGQDAEAEFISVEGELKECVLWFGPLKRQRRRATILPGDHFLAADTPADAPAPGPVGRYLYDPDPAVIRSGLVTDLALLLDAHQIDERIAYLTGDHLAVTPFAKVYAVEEAMPFNRKHLAAWLRERNVGRVNIHRRGSAVQPEELARQLKLRGDEFREVFLTQVQGKPWAVVGGRCDGEGGTM